MGIPVAKEVYADREHTASGSIVLTRRGQKIEDYRYMAERVVRMVKEGKVVAHTGEEVSIETQTVCIHGDTPGAPTLAKVVVQTLKENGIQVTSVREVLGID